MPAAERVAPPFANVRPRTPLVGRATAVRRLKGALDDAMMGSGSSLLLVGGAGSGKSRLLAELAAEARLVHVAFYAARVTGDETAAGLTAWLPILRACLDGLDEEKRTDLVANAPAPLRGLLQDSTPAILSTSGHFAFLAGAQARFHLIDAAARILFAAAEATPAIFAIDDLDHADILSIQLFAYLAHHARGYALAAVAAISDEVPNDTREASVFIRRISDRARRIELVNFTRGEVTELVQMTDPSLSDQVHDIYESTRGSPLLVHEAMDWIHVHGPGAELPWEPGPLVRGPLHRLTSDVRALLEVAAVMGFELDVAALSYAARMELIDVLPLVAQAVERGALVRGPESGRVAFRNRLFREAVYENIRESRRSTLHRRAADALERRYGAAAIPLIARHLLASGPSAPAEKVAEATRRAADAKLAVFACEDAAALYEHALAASEANGATPLERFALLMQLARAYREAANLGSATRAFLAAADLARKHDMAGNLARAALGLRTCLPLWEGVDGLIFRSRMPVGADRLTDLYRVSPELLREALEALPEGDRELRARVLSHLADMEPPGKQRTTSRKALELATGTCDPMTQFDVLSARLQALTGPDDLDEMAGVAERILRLSEQQQQPYWAWDARYRRRLAFIMKGERERADAEMWELERIAERLHHPVLRSAVRGLEIASAIEQGRFDDADRLLSEPDPSGERVLFPLQELQRQYFSERLAQLRGKKTPLLLEYSEFLRRYGYIGPVIRAGVAASYLEIGRADDARNLYAEITAERLRSIPRDANFAATLAYIAVLASAFRDKRRCRTLLSLLTPYAELNVIPIGIGSLGSASRYMALAAEGADEPTLAEEAFQRAVRMNERMRARPQLALTQFELGRFYSRRRAQRSRATEPLSRALGLAREIGMRALVERTEALLSELQG